MSESPVEVIAQFPHPATETPAYHRPASNLHLVELRGVMGSEKQSLTAIVGSEGVTTTDGWGKYAKVQRRQRTALTVAEGYEPYTISLPILLDAAYLFGDHKHDIEHQVAILEWFGGRGPMFSGKPGLPGIGPTPIIGVYSSSELVPKWCQSGRGKEGSILYVLEKIEYNTLGREYMAPIRRSPGGENPGRRIRQAATLTLLEHVGASNDPQNAYVHQINEERKHKYLHFTVSGGINTFTKIAKHYLAKSEHKRIPESAREIQQANPKLGTSVNKALAHGTKVRVPESATDQHAA